MARRAWKRVKGPIAAAALTLARIGWRFDGPFELVADEGATITLTVSSPAMVKSLAREGMRRELERALGVKWALTDQTYVGRRVCVDLAVQASRPGSRLSPLQSATFRSAACGAVMTASRAVRLGYDVPDVCPLCGEAGDTLYHRVYACRASAAAVAAAVPAWFLAEARRAPPGERFWTTACCAHPGDLVVGPTNALVTEVERIDGAAPEAVDDDGSAMCFGGHLCIDGSCKPHVIHGLARAAAAVVETTATGAARRIATIRVPRHPKRRRPRSIWPWRWSLTSSRGRPRLSGTAST